MSKAFWLVLLGSFVAVEEPVLVGVVGSGTGVEGSAGQAFVAGARAAVERWNLEGGVLGRPIELLVEDDGATARGVREAMSRMHERGITGVLGPTEATAYKELASACRRSKLPFVTPYCPTEACIAELEQALLERLRMTRVALVTDKSSWARELAKAWPKSLATPISLVLELDVDAKPKDLARALEEARPEVFVFDGEPAAVAEALSTTFAETRIPILLTPRAYGDALAATERKVYVLLGLSPAATPLRTPFLAQWRKEHGEPGFGVGEGHDAASLLLTAIEAAGSTDHAAVSAGLRVARLYGLRGPAMLRDDSPGLDAPYGLWCLEAGSLRPYLPAPRLAVEAGGGHETLGSPDSSGGAYFGTWRSASFRLEEATQWVLFGYGDGERSTIEDDLLHLGLSTDGAEPLLDHLVEEELLARVLAITSTKYLRNEDGTAIPGKSLNISFAIALPPKANKPNPWSAIIAGDHSDAGGQAFPGMDYCMIYSTFIRRTIFEPHRLDPPLSPEDLALLDGSYVFGTDHLRDKRSNMIRSLIDGYAGSMALTAAHEIGHLAGLGHITDDPLGIMNVDEGAGIDYREGRFSAGSLERLQKSLGVAE